MSTIAMTNEQRAAASAALHIHEETNGHAPPVLNTITLSSGVTVGIRKVSPYVLDAVNRAFPAPPPPVEEVDFGNGDVRKETNEADPDYKAALKAHNLMLAGKVQEVIWRLGIVPDIDHDRLNALRAVMDAVGAPLPADDHMAYINYIAINGQQDMQALITAVTSISQPTEDAIQQTIATFPGDVSGS